MRVKTAEHEQRKRRDKTDQVGIREGKKDCNWDQMSSEIKI